MFSQFTGVFGQFTGVFSQFTGVFGQFTAVFSQFTGVCGAVPSLFTGVLGLFTGVFTGVCGAQSVHWCVRSQRAHLQLADGGQQTCTVRPEPPFLFTETKLHGEEVTLRERRGRGSLKKRRGKEAWV